MYSAAFNQPTRDAQSTGLRRLLSFLGFCFVLISLGCNADPRCRRETALMRAEILDIEDKYAALKSKYESTAMLLHEYTGEPIDQTLYGATSNYHDVILNQEIISGGEIITDGGTYPTHTESYSPENVIYGTPVQSYPQQFESYPGQQGIITDTPATQLNAPHSALVDPTQNFGQPVEANPFNESIGEGILAPQSAPQLPASPNREVPLLPDASRNQRGTDDFELELPGQKRRTVPALQASATLHRNSTVHSNAGTHHSTPTEIVINRSMTSGQNVNDLPGDDGLNLLLQTKDANGQIVLQSGELTVSLIDPKQRQRVGFWRFIAGETELFFVDKNENTDGILLHLPWDESIPQRARLLVHVSFITQDGRTLTTSSDVLIKPPTADYSPEDPTVINWTQRDTRWGDSDGSYVSTELEPLKDPFQVKSRQRAESPSQREGARQREEAWQRNGTYNRGAKFSQSSDHEYSNDGDSDNDSDYERSRSADRSTSRNADAADNPDQPKWRPVR